MDGSCASPCLKQAALQTSSWHPSSVPMTTLEPDHGHGQEVRYRGCKLRSGGCCLRNSCLGLNEAADPLWSKWQDRHWQKWDATWVCLRWIMQVAGDQVACKVTKQDQTAALPIWVCSLRLVNSLCCQPLSVALDKDKPSAKRSFQQQPCEVHMQVTWVGMKNGVDFGTSTALMWLEACQSELQGADP
eukprot:363169-Chlamydomonas_euryale.AAC.47